MKRLLSLILALLMTVALFGVSGAMKYAYAEGDGEEPSEPAEPVNPYVGLWEITGRKEGEVYTPYGDGEEKIYMDFLPNGVIYAILYDGEDADEDYAAYKVTGENALTLFEGDDPILGVYDPETGIITVTAEAVNGPYITYLHVWAMVDHSEEEQQYYGYEMRDEEQVMDLVEFLAIVDEDPDEYYCLTMQPDGTGYVQFGSEELGGDILWDETQIIAVGNEDEPAPYTRKYGHVIMDIKGTIMDFAPVGEIEILTAVKGWELKNLPAQIPEDMEGTWELFNCKAYGVERTPEQMNISMTFVLNLNGTAVLYTNDLAPAGYRLSQKEEGTWILSSGGVELYELQYDGTVLTLNYMGVDMLFEKAEG